MDQSDRARDFHTIRWFKGCFPIACVTGETPDISEYLDFGFYDHISYKYNSGLGMTAIGRWLVVSHRVGGLVSYWIMAQKGMVISITVFQRLTSLEKDTDKFKAGVSEFDTDISLRFKEE